MTDKNNGMSFAVSVKERFVTGAILTAAVMLSGCTQVIVPDFTSTGSVFGATQSPAFEHTLSETRSKQDAFLLLPEDSGSVLEVTQSRHGNGVKQIIVYEGDNTTRGQNIARVSVVAKPSAFGSKANNLKIDPTSVTQIRREMRRELPGVRMQMSNEFQSNAYGPFGYASGRASNGVQCIYGWQQMKGQGQDRWALWRGESQKPELSVRLRVCRSGVSADRLVNLMRNLRVNVDPEQAMRSNNVSWNAGQSRDMAAALPDYEPGGYVSDQRVAEPEPVTVRNSTPKRQVVRNRIVKRQRSVAKREVAVVKQPVVSGVAYKSPTYGGAAVKAASSATTVVVPTPTQIAPSPAVKAQVYNTLNAPTPVYTPPVRAVARQTVASSFPSVPLPN